MDCSKSQRRIGLFLLACFLSMAVSLQAQTPQNEVPKVVRKSSGVLTASATKRVEPTYPLPAYAAQVSGSVVVEVMTDEDGKVVEARALSGHPMLKDAAVAAARQWEFTPTALSGVRVKVVGTLTFTFTYEPTQAMLKGLEEAREKVRLNPQSAEAHLELGEAYGDVGKYQEAVDSYQEAIRLKPDLEGAYLELATVYQQMGRYEEALITYKQGSENVPDSVDLLICMGYALERLKRFDQSIVVFKKLTEREPKNGDYLDSLGWAYFKLGELEESEHYLLKAVELSPASAIIQEHVGDLYQRQGKMEQAVAAWQKALEQPGMQKIKDRIKTKLEAANKK